MVCKTFQLYGCIRNVNNLFVTIISVIFHIQKNMIHYLCIQTCHVEHTLVVVDILCMHIAGKGNFLKILTGVKDAVSKQLRYIFFLLSIMLGQSCNAFWCIIAKKVVLFLLRLSTTCLMKLNSLGFSQCI